MAKVVNLITDNIVLIQRLVKHQILPLSLMQNYDIYSLYQSIDYEKQQMKRYAIVAKRCKVSISSVRRAIREMEKTA